MEKVKKVQRKDISIKIFKIRLFIVLKLGNSELDTCGAQLL
jgi:hypothetical protein